MEPRSEWEDRLKGDRSMRRLVDVLDEFPDIKTDWVSVGELVVPRLNWSDGEDPVRVGIFGAIHGDEPAGAAAVVQLFREIARNKGIAEGYELLGYPVCNPSGFERNQRNSKSGRDLNREFWKGSAEPEVQWLERELATHRFHGLIQLHADDTSHGVYGFVRGATLTEHLLRPALQEAGKILPRNVNATIDGFAARDGIIFEHYEGVLAAPVRMDPAPFEIILETPQEAPVDLQVRALVAAMQSILGEYRSLIAFAANL